MDALSAPLLTPLRRIAVPKGDVLHGMKSSDPGFAGFGEAYFSMVADGAVKGWKRHLRMTLNLVCVAGAVRFVVYGEGAAPALDAVLSPDDASRYRRLTVPPGFWVAFGGAAPGESTILNVASIPHDPTEAETVPLDRFAWPDLPA